MSTPLVVVFPRGQLNPKDKERMTKAGIVAIEADDPKSVHQLNLSSPMLCTAISGDMLVHAALKSMAGQSPETSAGYITSVGRAAHAFVEALSDSIATPAKSTS